LLYHCAKAYYEHKLHELKLKQEYDFIYTRNKFSIDISIINEANNLLYFYKHKVLKSSIPIKEMLQYSDKMKIDKFLMSKKLEADIDNWERLRISIEEVKEKQEIDLNARRAKKRKLDQKDVLIVDEVYEDLN
jgi:hypothetical protein